MRLLRITYTAQSQFTLDTARLGSGQRFDHAMQNEVHEIHSAPPMDANTFSNSGMIHTSAPITPITPSDSTMHG